MNTQICYQYRDASNYKKWNEQVVLGVLTEEQKNRIEASCDEGEYFIPRQVGLPEERFDDVTEDDHCWFELASINDTDREPTVDVTAQQLYESFLISAGNWDETLWMEGGGGSE